MDWGLTEIAAIITVVVPLLSFFYYAFRQRAKHQIYYSTIWKSSKKLKPEELLGERPFKDYYETRNFDNLITTALKECRNILIIGQPLAGKTRTTYENLKKSDNPFDVLIPRCCEIDPDSFVFPYRARFWRKGVVVLDDLQRFVEQRGFEILLRKIISKHFTIIATSRTKLEYKNVENKFASQGIHLDSIFGENIIEIPLLDEDTAKKVAQNTQIDWIKICKRFNGTIGSIFMKLEEMQKRFDTASDDEKNVLRTIQKLYLCGIFKERGSFPIEWIRKIISYNNANWSQTIEALQAKEFIKVDKGTIKLEPVYLEDIIIPFPEIELRLLCSEMAETFENEPQILLKIGDRLMEIGKHDLDISSFLKDAIILFQKVLDHFSDTSNSYDKAWTLNNLGNAYRNLASIENKADNCKQAITAYDAAIKIRTIEMCPMDYATTQINRGNAYGTLAEVEDKAENCKKAIAIYDEALKIYTIKIFPAGYAIAQNNRGIVYNIFADVEDQANNCKRAIVAFDEALKIHSLEKFPIEYAVIQSNRGIAYRTLAEVEDKADNCKRAIAALGESLKIYTIEGFAIDFGTTQYNRGIAYRTLAEVEDKADNCKRAIAAFDESLKIFTLKRFPQQYHLALENRDLTITRCRKS